MSCAKSIQVHVACVLPFGVIKKIVGYSSDCFPMWIQRHILSTLGLKQWNYSWGLHVKCNSMRNQEEGEELIVFITSVEGSDLRFLIEMAKLPTCLCREAYLHAGAAGHRVLTGQQGCALPFPAGTDTPRQGWGSSQGQEERTRALALDDGAPAAMWALLQKPFPLKQLQSERWVCFLCAKHSSGVI